MADDSVSLGIVLLKIVGFFAFSGIIGLIFYKMYKKWVDEAEKELHRHTIIAFVFCLIMAFVAEEVFGVADITGAYIAGLIISNVQRSTYLESKFDTMSYLLLSPVFFASIGLEGKTAENVYDDHCLCSSSDNRCSNYKDYWMRTWSKSVWL